MPTLRPLLLFCLCFIGPVSSFADNATAAVASNFTLAMSDLIKEFEHNHPHQLKQSVASSGMLFNQIINGAPFDLLLSANSRYPQHLEKRGLGSGRFTYARGQLVLASRGDIPSQPRQIAVMLQKIMANGGKIAIANPEVAPYGIAAKQLLQHLALWPARQGSVVRGNNINQTFQYIATGNTQVGLVALSQMIYFNDPSLQYRLLPANSYQPIQQQAILLQSGQHNPAALAFMIFLRSKQAQHIIQRHGYLFTE